MQNAIFFLPHDAMRIVAVLGTGAGDNVTSAGDSEHVDLDLRHGIVKGYSQYVTFVASPAPRDDDRCSAQSVIAIDLSRGPFNRVRLTLDYDQPRLWTVDVSDSIHADGYGLSHSRDDAAGNGTKGSMAETHVRLSKQCSHVFAHVCLHFLCIYK